jgi:hypothetical protein
MQTKIDVRGESLVWVLTSPPKLTALPISTSD